MLSYFMGMCWGFQSIFSINFLSINKANESFLGLISGFGAKVGWKLAA